MPADLPSSPWFRRALLAALLLLIVVLTFSVLRPFLVPLTWGGILAYVSWPLNQRLLRWCGNRTSIAALGTTLFVTLVIIVPLVWLILTMRVEAVNGYAKVQAFLGSKPTLPPVVRDLPYIGSWLDGLLTQLSADPTALRREMVT